MKKMSDQKRTDGGPHNENPTRRGQTADPEHAARRMPGKGQAVKSNRPADVLPPKATRKKKP